MGPDDTDATVDGLLTVQEPGSRERTARRTSSPGERDDRYRLGELIGKGGMGEVIAARDENIGREVAIKRMLSDDPSPAQIARFLREARIQGRLDHPAIPPVHELARDAEGRPFFVMKLLSGTTLSNILEGLADGDPDIEARHTRHGLLRAFADVCLAVELAHTRGVIHRDLKPANIMLGDFGETYVLDWGVAKVRGDADVESFDAGERSPAETAVGVVVGTPPYMAPEQLLGQEIDGRADVYALGCILFEILAGQRLHGNERHHVILAVDARPSIRAPSRDIAPELDAICVAATHPERDDRLPTAREMAERVQRFLDGDRDLAKRRELAVAHLSRATTAIEVKTNEARGTAMREAGRALALDPTLADAADMVGRLMIDPPSTTPPEVEQAIEREMYDDNKQQGRAALIGYVGYAAFIPLSFWIGVQEPRYLLLFASVIVLNMLLVWRGTRRGITRTTMWTFILGNMLLIGIGGRMVSPFILGPGLAAATSMALITNNNTRTDRDAVMCTGLMILGVFAPWFAEKLGLLSATMRVHDGVLLIDSPMLAITSTAIEVGLALYTIALVAFAALQARTSARGERAARRRLHLQAWQLGHLVPRSPAP